MRNDQHNALTEARVVVERLRSLGDVTAPADLRARVLSALDLGDAYFQIATPLGEVYVAYNASGIAMVAHAVSDAEFERIFAGRSGRTAYRAVLPPHRLVTALQQHLSGDSRATLRFDLSGVSEFERAVLLKALAIPRGEVRPYAWVAREIGSPKAVRAVGTALAHNPIPVLIPCHRVVRSDGQLGRYSMGGDEAKRHILTAEGVAPERLEELARAGVRYFGSDTTHIYCFPTCRHARRVTARHLQLFASEAQARAAGYRACKVCRPSQAS